MRPGNMAAAATRVVLRRRMRARQSMSTTTAAMNARPPTTPPIIAAIFLEMPLCVWDDGSCDEESPGTDVCDVAGVGDAARVPVWPALTSVLSVCVERGGTVACV